MRNPRHRIDVTYPDGETFVFIWTTPHRTELLKTFGRYASDPGLAFGWAEAAVLSKKVREMEQEQCHG